MSDYLMTLAIKGLLYDKEPDEQLAIYRGISLLAAYVEKHGPVSAMAVRWLLAKESKQ